MIEKEYSASQSILIERDQIVKSAIQNESLKQNDVQAPKLFFIPSAQLQKPIQCQLRLSQHVSFCEERKQDQDYQPPKAIDDLIQNKCSNYVLQENYERSMNLRNFYQNTGNSLITFRSFCQFCRSIVKSRNRAQSIQKLEFQQQLNLPNSRLTFLPQSQPINCSQSEIDQLIQNAVEVEMQDLTLQVYLQRYFLRKHQQSNKNNRTNRQESSKAELVLKQFNIWPLYDNFDQIIFKIVNQFKLNHELENDLKVKQKEYRLPIKQFSIIIQTIVYLQKWKYKKNFKFLTFMEQSLKIQLITSKRIQKKFQRFSQQDREILYIIYKKAAQRTISCILRMIDNISSDSQTVIQYKDPTFKKQMKQQDQEIAKSHRQMWNYIINQEEKQYQKSKEKKKQKKSKQQMSESMENEMSEQEGQQEVEESKKNKNSKILQKEKRISKKNANNRGLK